MGHTSGMIHRELLIDGIFLGGECDTQTPKQVVRSPHNMTIVGSAAEAGPAAVEAATTAAARAFAIWKHSPRYERQGLLRRIAAALRERRSELAMLAAEEIGKPITWAGAELDRSALTFDLAADLLDDFGRVSMPVDYDPRGAGYTAVAERFPIGSILCITPYNWPFNLAAHKIAPALAAGNTIILKGSGAASLCTLTLARLIHEAGCPPGVLNALNCDPDLAESIAVDPRVAMVSFTGSPAVGWHLKRLCPEKRVALELGGDATAIVCDDADLDWAAQRCALGGYGYAGQVCISVQHVLADQRVYEGLRSRLVVATKETPHGDPREAKCVCGPMISPEAAIKVAEWVAEAVDAGAEVLAGGKRIGNAVEPTLVEFPEQWSGSPPRLAQEEVFGPVLTLSRFVSYDEALARVNGSEYGIQTGVFTRDLRRAEQAFRTLEVGGVVIGDYPTLRFDSLPYGGVKQSGFGREGVRFAMEEMSEWKTMVTRIGI